MATLRQKLAAERAVRAANSRKNRARMSNVRKRLKTSTKRLRNRGNRGIPSSRTISTSRSRSIRRTSTRSTRQATQRRQSRQAQTQREQTSAARQGSISGIKSQLGLPTGSGISDEVNQLLKTLGGDPSKLGQQLNLSGLSSLGLAKAKFELDRRRKEAGEAANIESRGKRREAAVKSASLQRKSLALRAEERASGLSRELSGLRRQARQKRSEILSGASSRRIVGSSASRAARISLKSEAKREFKFAGESAARASQADVLRRQEIAGNLESALFENREPEKVFLSQADITQFEGDGISSSTISNTLIT